MEFIKKMRLNEIAGILGIVSFFIATITIPKDQLLHLTNIILFPLSFFIDHLPIKQDSRLLHWIYIVVSGGIYISIVWGLIRIIIQSKHHNKYELMCEDEIASMLEAVESGKVPRIEENIIHFMREFDRNALTIFKAKKGVYKSFWVLPKDHQSNEFLLSNVNQLTHTKEDRKIIKWALEQPNQRFYDKGIKRNFKGVNEEFVFVRNYGEFKVGFAILFNEKNIINDKKLKHFVQTSSHLMLLGNIDKLTKQMVELLKRREENNENE